MRQQYYIIVVYLSLSNAHTHTHSHHHREPLCATVRQEEAWSSAAYHCHDHKRQPWKLLAWLHHNLQLMQLFPTNSPYLTGRTSSFHGNRTEQEKSTERWGDRAEDECWGCGEKRAYRKREVRNMSRCFVSQKGNVTLEVRKRGERGELRVGGSEKCKILLRKGKDGATA